MCGTPVQAIWDHKNLIELTGGVSEGQNLPQGPEWPEFGSEAVERPPN